MLCLPLIRLHLIAVVNGPEQPHWGPAHTLLKVISMKNEQIHSALCSASPKKKKKTQSTAHGHVSSLWVRTLYLSSFLHSSKDFLFGVLLRNFMSLFLPYVSLGQFPTNSQLCPIIRQIPHAGFTWEGDVYQTAAYAESRGSKTHSEKSAINPFPQSHAHRCVWLACVSVMDGAERVCAIPPTEGAQSNFLSCTPAMVGYRIVALCSPGDAHTCEPFLLLGQPWPKG